MSTKVILLLGAPGTGKTLLGRYLESHSAGNAVFVSVGEELRASGELEVYIEHPSTERRLRMNEQTRDIIVRCLRKSEKDSTERGENKPILLLEAVKDIGHAYLLMEILEACGATLVQVLFVPGVHIASILLGGDRLDNDCDRRPEVRLRKWEANIGLLIEFFSSLGCMSEVILSPLSRERVTLAKHSIQPIVPSLTSHGYTSPDEDSPLLGLGLKLPSTLEIMRIEYVTSPRLVINRLHRENVLVRAATNTGLHILNQPPGGLKLPVPLNFVSDQQDLEWIAREGRYHVTSKCDGTRCLLIIHSDGVAYCLNRAGSLYAFPTRVGRGTSVQSLPAQLPPGTTLDGELVWRDGRGYFLAFDIISHGPARSWQETFANRLEVLSNLLVEAEECVELQETVSTALGSICESPAASRTPSVSKAGQGPNTPSQPELRKKQQAPPVGRDTVTVVYKRHLPVSTHAIETMLGTESRETCLFPSDGLVFTPSVMPYALGMPELLFKWQPESQIGADLSSASKDWHLCSQAFAPLPGVVYECLPKKPEDPEWVSRAMSRKKRRGLSAHQTLFGQTRKSTTWQPMSIRWDKTGPNTCGIIGQSRVSQFTTSHDLISSFQKLGKSTSQAPEFTESSVDGFHLAKTVPFEDLRRKILEAVESGKIERYVDAESRLEIFNYKKTQKLQVSWDTQVCNVPLWEETTALHAKKAEGSFERPEDFCRGLVLHPPSQTVVATPFAQFQQLDVYRNSSAFKNLSCHASIKVDGTLVIVFRWNGVLKVATRRRMDSEQALWAKHWLISHANVCAVEPGWTYLFEAVYQDNTVVVPYSFEGMVLLSAISPSGVAISAQQRIAIACKLNVMAVPYVVCDAADIRRFVGGSKDESACIFEGWVLSLPFTASLYKAVKERYIELSLRAQQMHPRSVWDSIRREGKSRSELLEGLPEHLKKELMRIIEAIEQAYCGIRRLLQIILILVSQQFGLSEVHHLRKHLNEGKSFPVQYNRLSVQILQAACTFGEGSLQTEEHSVISTLRSFFAGIILKFSKLENSYIKPLDLKDLMHRLKQEDPKELWLQHLFSKDLPEKVGFASIADSEDISKIRTAMFEIAKAIEASGYDSSPILIAFQHAFQKGEIEDSSMFYCPRYSCYNSNAFRRLILDCVRPGLNGELPGYTPAPNMQQTWVKGWQGGPEADKFRETPLINRLHENLLSMILYRLDGLSIISARVVCIQWSAVIKVDSDFRKKVSEYRAQKHAAEREAFEASLERRSYFGGYGSGSNWCYDT